tara:strand:- start:2910 stop:3206 length:297 start_codon:yes stop_codon:yes gene_type:complete
MNRYSKIPQTNYNKKRAYRTVRYPEIPLDENDTYVISQAGDRFDMLADQYYGDSTLWWVISIANENFQQNSMVVPEGQQVRIPTGISNILYSFEQINR